MMRLAKPQPWTKRRGPAGPGFTLIELLIVVVIVAAAAVIVVPSVTRLIESANYSRAVNIISASLGNARSRAILTGNTTAVAFLFNVETEAYTLQVLELQEGGFVLTNRPRSSSVTERDIYARAFRPAEGIAAVRLPSGVGVYGLSFSTSPSLGGELGPDIDNDTDHWYAGERLANVGGGFEIPWLFPRNDPLLFARENLFNDDDERSQRQEFWRLPAGNAGAVVAARHAQSFAIVFDENGRVVSTDVSGGLPTPNAYIEFEEGPLDLSEPVADREPVDSGVAFDPETGLGEDIEPNPEVLLRSAQYLAVVSFPRMREELGPIIRDTPPWLYRTERSGRNLPEGRMIEDDEVVIEINKWIDNNAQVLAFNPYTGVVIKKDTQ
jgi:prepilin-type N-terminal cleavage/methylation domain-containing protein